MSVAVRRLREADAAEYRAIRLATLATEPEFFGAIHAVEAARPLVDFAAALGGSYIFGAYEGARICGTVRFTPGTAKEAHKGGVHGFFVRPEDRGRGAGGALMQAAIDAARGRVEQLTLSVVQGNDAAIGLYRRFGFTIYGVEPKARKSAGGYQDIVLMVAFL